MTTRAKTDTSDLQTTQDDTKRGDVLPKERIVDLLRDSIKSITTP